MKTAIDVVTRLHDHRAWARRRILDVVRPLSEAQRRQTFPMGLGSIMGTLTHCYGAELAWLSVLEKGDPGINLPGADAFPTLAALETAWAAVDKRWKAFWEKLCVSMLDEPAMRRRDGKDLTTSTGEVLLHVCTHQHYHMAQISNMLRQIGVTPIASNDLIVMAREEWLSGGRAAAER